MNCKKFALAVSLAAVFCFIGCDDSSSSPSATGDEPVLSSDSNGGEGGEVTSNDSKDGKEKAAESSDAKDEKASAGDSKDKKDSSGDSKDEKASGDKDKKDSGDKKDSSGDSKDSGSKDSGDKDKTPSSDSKDDGANPTVPGGMTFDSTAFASMFSCTEEGATQNQMGYVRVCTNGQWVYDSTATAEANKCTEEGATKTDSSSTMGFTMAMTYVCKDGQ
jgi:hypothetical protein